MSIWDRLANVDRRAYYVVLILVVALPIIKPWGLPIRVSKSTQDFYDAIEAVPNGGTIALAIDYRSDCIVELNPQVLCIYRHAWAKDIKIIMWSNVDEGANVTEPITRQIGEELGKTYGVHWVNLGFKPGGDATKVKMVDNFWEGAAYVDMNGTPLDQLPIMQGFNSLKDADLLINMMAVVPSPAEAFLKMVAIPHKVPMAVGTTAIQAPTEMPYYSSGQYKGLLSGLRGAAEYEFLLNSPGSAMVGMDAQSAAHILVILLIVLGNLGYFLSERKNTKGLSVGGDK
ncbi:MAG: hypothetical protein ACOX3V_00945 [Bacillota bacterium]|jgi:hypothetical protein